MFPQGEKYKVASDKLEDADAAAAYKDFFDHDESPPLIMIGKMSGHL
jgi:hypothetical protein